MVMTNRLTAIFQDARELEADALEMLVQGKIRNAAEQSWGGNGEGHRRPSSWPGGRARRRSSLPRRPTLRTLESLDEAVREAHLLRRYYSRQVVLHGECFYNGLCDPLDDTERRIRETSGYIEDAERLAEGETPS